MYAAIHAISNLIGLNYEIRNGVLVHLSPARAHRVLRRGGVAHVRAAEAHVRHPLRALRHRRRARSRRRRQEARARVRARQRRPVRRAPPAAQRSQVGSCSLSTLMFTPTGFVNLPRSVHFTVVM